MFLEREDVRMYQQLNSVSGEARNSCWLMWLVGQLFVTDALLPLGQGWNKCGHTSELNFDKILFPDACLSKAATSTTKWKFLSLKKVVSKKGVMTSLWAVFRVLLIHWPQTTGDSMWSRWMRKEDTFLRAYTTKHLWNLKSLMGAKEWGHGPAWMTPSLTVKQTDCSSLQAKTLISFALIKSTLKGGYAEL